MKRKFLRSRRQFLKRGAAGFAGVAAAVAAGRVRVQEAEKVDPSEELAQQFDYVEDASQAPSDQRGENEFCYNCQYFQGEQETGDAPCVIFGGRLVEAQGWCNSWVMRV